MGRGCLARFAFVAAAMMKPNVFFFSEKGTFSCYVLEAVVDIVDGVDEYVHVVLISPKPSPYTDKQEEANDDTNIVVVKDV